MMFFKCDKRTVSSVNGVWDFCFSANHDFSDEQIAEINYDDRLPVPCAFDAMPRYNGKRGVGFFRTMIEIAPERRARICFGAVGMYGKVFIDGVKVGEHYSAYTSFECEIPKSAKPRRELVVMCCNRFDFQTYPLHEIFFDFYAYGGIFRDVNLQILPEGDLLEQVRVDTLDYQTGKIKVTVYSAKKHELTARIDNGAVTSVPAGTISFELIVPGCNPWSPENPELHLLTIDNGSDSVTVRFGVRQVWTEKGQIMLNGKPIKLLGYCRHEAHPQYGPALPYQQLAADLQLMRELGCNFVRGSHYPQDQRFLALCDELGFLVFEESMGWGQNRKHFIDRNFIAAQLRQTSEMITASYNNPCVILRAFLNEGESDVEEARECYEALIKLIRAEDPHRLLTYASHKFNRDLFLEQIDVISFNIYPGWYTENIHDEHPTGEIVPAIRKHLDDMAKRGLADKPFILSEIGVGALYGWRDPMCCQWTEEFQREYLQITCEEVVSNDKIAGLALWQFCDCRTYRGSRSLGRPRSFNNKGTFDEYRRPKMAAEVVKQAFAKAKK